MVYALYDILGVGSCASQEEIRTAFKRKALETHPDKLNPNASEAEKQAAQSRFREVYYAFETLSDPVKRDAHDARIRVRHNYSKEWSRLAELQAKREEERKKWAQAAEDRYQARMKIVREVSDIHRKGIDEHKREVDAYEAMVQEMLDSLCALSPEWEERKRLARQRKT